MCHPHLVNGLRNLIRVPYLTDHHQVAIDLKQMKQYDLRLAFGIIQVIRRIQYFVLARKLYNYLLASFINAFDLSLFQLI